MESCTACGQPGSDTARFCSGCGAPYQTPADRPEETLPPLARPWPPPPPPPSAADDPYANLYREPSANRPDRDHDETLSAPFARYSREASLLPQDAPPPSLPPAAAETVGLPGPAWAPPPPGRGHRKTLIAALASVALLAVAGAAYGTYAWLTHRHHAPVSAGSAGSPPPVSPSGSPAAGNDTVAVAPAVARNPGAQPVVNLLTSYFTAINTHDYRAYSRLIDQRLRNGLTPARFQAGYGSTTDSRATLTGISTAADGRVTAAVTFTSHQRPEDGPDHSACTLWNITLFLEPQNDGFVLGPAPPGYHASHQPC